MTNPIVIIGAGLSGLAAALEVEAAGEDCLLIDQNAQIGGKLETTIVDESYRLDRGFQVLLPAYPELRRLGDLQSELQLKSFHSGARLETKTGAVLMADPLRHPLEFFSTAFGNYGTLRDKLLVVKLQHEVQKGSLDGLLTSRSGTTADDLRAYGFSETIINCFWRPFFSGIFLETELDTAAGYFRYLVRIFADAPVAVPRLGIGELPKLLASRLKRSEIRLSTKVTSFTKNSVTLETGEEIPAAAVVTETNGHRQQAQPVRYGHVISYWFSAPEAPFEGRWLSLHAKDRQAPAGERLINHVAVMSNISRDYAMKGDALVCVNLVRESSTPPEAILPALLVEATSVYGNSVSTWKLLRADHITRPFELYIDRTDVDTPSQQGALGRGRRAAAEALNAR